MKYILTKVAKRFYCIRYLVRARINPCDIVVIYCSVIRSILEYACPVWHPGLSEKQETDLERVQKRCLTFGLPRGGGGCQPPSIFFLVLVIVNIISSLKVASGGPLHTF